MYDEVQARAPHSLTPLTSARCEMSLLVRSADLDHTADIQYVMALCRALTSSEYAKKVS